MPDSNCLTSVGVELSSIVPLGDELQKCSCLKFDVVGSYKVENAVVKSFPSADLHVLGNIPAFHSRLTKLVGLQHTVVVLGVPAKTRKYQKRERIIVNFTHFTGWRF